MCSCRLLSFPIGYRHLALILRGALFFSHFKPHEVYEHPVFSQIIQSRLCCLPGTTSTRPAFTSTFAASGCSLPRRRSHSSVTLFMSTKITEDFHSQVNCTSKIVLAKQTSDFHSQVNCTSKTVLAKRTSDSLASQLQFQDCTCRL